MRPDPVDLPPYSYKTTKAASLYFAFYTTLYYRGEVLDGAHHDTRFGGHFAARRMLRNHKQKLDPKEPKTYYLD